MKTSISAGLSWKWFSEWKSLAASILICLLTVILSGGQAAAQSLPLRQLHLAPPGGLDPDEKFGQSVAISPQFVLVGEPRSNAQAMLAGLAHVFDVRSGKWLRRLVPSTPTVNGYFGRAVAVSGPLGLVGATEIGVSKAGEVFLFDLRTGRQLRRWTCPGGGPGDRFGYSLAIQGDLALVGAPALDGNRGAAFLFSVSAPSGIPAALRLQAETRAPNDLFGTSVALEGRRCLAGASGYNASRGAVYLFDATLPDLPATRTEAERLLDPDAAAGDGLGFSVAFFKQAVLAGAPTALAGRGKVVDWNLAKPPPYEPNSSSPADTAPTDFYGYALAFNESMLAVAAPRQNENRGAVYYFPTFFSSKLTGFSQPEDLLGSSVAVCMDMVAAGSPGIGVLLAKQVAVVEWLFGGALATGDGAPGIPGAAVRKVHAQAIGPGSTAGVVARGSVAPFGSRQSTEAVWRTSEAFGQPLSLLLRARQSQVAIAPAVNRSFVTINHNREGQPLLHSRVSPDPALPDGEHALWRSVGGVPQMIFRTGGDTGAGFAGGRLRELREFTQSALDRIALSVRLRQGSGSGTGETLVAQGNDSAVFFLDHSGLRVGQVFREGITTTAPAGVIGDLDAAVAIQKEGTFFSFSAAHIETGDTRARHALFNQPFSLTGAVIQMREGDLAPGVIPAGPKYRRFLGHTITAAPGYIIQRASLAGPGVNSGNNEGLWTQSLDQSIDCAQRGPGGCGAARPAGGANSGVLAGRRHQSRGLSGPANRARGDQRQ